MIFNWGKKKTTHEQPLCHRTTGGGNQRGVWQESPSCQSKLSVLIKSSPFSLSSALLPQHVWGFCILPVAEGGEGDLTGGDKGDILTQVVRMRKKKVYFGF